MLNALVYVSQLLRECTLHSELFRRALQPAFQETVLRVRGDYQRAVYECSEDWSRARAEAEAFVESWVEHSPLLVRPEDAGNDGAVLRRCREALSKVMAQLTDKTPSYRCLDTKQHVSGLLQSVSTLLQRPFEAAALTRGAPRHPMSHTEENESTTVGWEDRGGGGGGEGDGGEWLGGRPVFVPAAAAAAATTISTVASTAVSNAQPATIAAMPRTAAGVQFVKFRGY